MDFSIDLGELQKSLRVIGSVARPNTTEPSGQVVIELSNNGDILFLSTNSRLSVTSVVKGCKVKDEGTFSVIYGKLSSFVNYFQPYDDVSGVKEVKFKKNKGGVSVHVENHFVDGSSSKNKLNLKLYDVYKIAVPKKFEESDFTINAAILRNAIAKVVYAINSNEQRPFMQGMNIRFSDDFIYFAGTDALKLSEYKVKNTGNKKDGSYIVPYRFIMSLRKIIDAESPVFFEISNSDIKAAIDDTVVYGTLIEGHDYPDYLPLFENYTDSITINKEVMLNSFIPFLNSLNDDDNARITIEMKEGKLKMFSDFSESEYEGKISFDGEFIIDINGSFLAQTLDAIKDDIVEVKFSDSKGLLLFNSANFKDQASLITPVQRR